MSAAADSARADGDRAATAVARLLGVGSVGILLAYVPALASPFVEPKLAVLELCGALAVLGWSVGSTRIRWEAPVVGAAAAFGLALILSALCAWQRGDPGAPYAGRELARVGAMLAVAIGAGFAATAAPNGARHIAEAILMGAGLVALLGLAQHLRVLPLPIPTISVPGSTFGNRNVAAEAVAMAIPFGLGVTFGGPAGDASGSAARRWQLGAVLLLAEVLYVAVARARGAWLGSALGIATFFALARPPLSPRFVRGGLALAALAIAAAAIPGRWAAHDALDAKRFEPAGRVVHEALDPASPVARTRLGLWRRTLALYRTHPLVGIGPGNFPVLFPRVAEPDAAADGVLSPTAVPRRAHDDLLERLAEMGPLGLGAWLALYVALGAAALRRARRAQRPEEATLPAAAAGSLAAFAASGLTGFPFAMPATVYLFGVALGLLAASGTAGAGGETRGRPWLALAPIALGLVALALWSSAGRLAASYWVARADETRGERPEETARALAYLRRGEAATPRDFPIALRLSAAALRAGRPHDAALAGERALTVEPYSANAWEALARARLAEGDPAGAAEAAERALAILHTYPAALATRAQAAARLGDAAAADGARARLSALAATDDDARRLLATLAAAPR